MNCRLCGAPVTEEKELDPAPNGAPRLRIFFECGGEVTLQRMKNHNWRHCTRYVCGARDPKEVVL